MSHPIFGHFSRAADLAGPIELEVTRPDDGSVKMYEFAQPFLLVGKAKAADLRLDHPSIGRRDAFLVLVGGRLLCVDLNSQSGVRQDGAPRRACWLAPGDRIAVGAYEIRLTGCPADPVPAADVADPLTARPADPTRLVDLALEIDTGAGRPTAWPMPQWVALAGRAGACAIRAADENLSAFHCAFVKTPSSLWVIDLLSETRTRLNGQVIRVARLKDGDLVRVGGVTSLVGSGPEGEVPAGRALAPVRPPRSIGDRDAGSEVVTPVHDLMRQFQDCLVVMARMFTALQQEQAALAREQIAEFQRAVRELRELRGEAAAAPFAAEVPADLPVAASADPPAPKPLDPAAADGLTDAHAWLTRRLAELEAGLGTGRR